jgi:hypothetical protein
MQLPIHLIAAGNSLKCGATSSKICNPSFTLESFLARFFRNTPITEETVSTSFFCEGFEASGTSWGVGFVGLIVIEFFMEFLLEFFIEFFIKFLNMQF